MITKKEYLFIKYRKEDFTKFIQSNDKPIYVKNTINDIMKQLVNKTNNLNSISRFLPLYIIKRIHIENEIIELIIKFLPIFFKEDFLFFKEINEDYYKINEKFKRFYKQSEEFFSNKSKSNIKLLNYKNDYEIEFEDVIIDYLYLKKIKDTLNRLKFTEKEEIIWSDKEVGIVDENLLEYVNIENVFPQKIKTKNKELYKIINSFIKLKFNINYLTFLKDNQENIYVQKLLKILKLIKLTTNYKKNKIWLSKRRLNGYINSKNIFLIKEKNKKLFNYLKELLKNKNYINSRQMKIKSIQMDKVWEQRVLKYVNSEKTFNSEKYKYQDKKEYLVDRNKDKFAITSKESRPDLVSENLIIDSKYKILNSDYFTKNTEDINKLIRDLVVWKKNIGYLILVKQENSSFNDLFEFEDIDNLSIKIKSINFFDS